MEHLLLTIVMPVYNAERYLRDAIECILQQTYRDFVFLIINDGSTDDSESIILSYHDTRIQYVKNEQNIKLVRTLNKALGMVQTKYVARMDADDISLPTRLEKQIAYMESHPSVGLLGTWCRTIGFDSGQETRYETTQDAIMFKQLYQIEFVHPTCMMRMEILRRMPVIYDETYLHAEDYDLFTRLSHASYVSNIPEVLHLYRKHENAVSVVYSSEQDLHTMHIRQREFANLGLSVTTQQVADFKALNYQDYQHIVSSDSEIQNMLESMYTANISSLVFEEIYLMEKLQSLWFSYCYEKRVPISVYKKSCLAQRISPIRYAKWHIKRLSAL